MLVDIYLEPRGAPLHELDAPHGLHLLDGRVHILVDDVSSVQQAAGHVLP